MHEQEDNVLGRILRIGCDDTLQTVKELAILESGYSVLLKRSWFGMEQPTTLRLPLVATGGW